MLELTPTLSVTLAPLVASTGGQVIRAMQQVAKSGLHAVQLSAAQPGLRPRELDRRARRDLLATLGRTGLMLSGWDLFIPREHWLDTTKIDRAMTATLQAITLAAESGRVSISLNLPCAELAADAVEALIAAAEGHDVPLVIYDEADPDQLIDWLKNKNAPALGAGLDVAASLATEGKPEDRLFASDGLIRSVRLGDYQKTGNPADDGRCPLGDGLLDLLTFRAALASQSSIRSLILELRGLDQPLQALTIGIQEWQND